MNAHLSIQLKVSGIANRNDSLPLLNAVKVCVNTHILRLVSPVNHVLRRFDRRITDLKLKNKLWLYAFRLTQLPALPIPL